jgi:hypothetical protein
MPKIGHLADRKNTQPGLPFMSPTVYNIRKWCNAVAVRGNTLCSPNTTREKRR